MKLPEKAPDWIEIFNRNNKAVFTLPVLLSGIIEKANKEYLYWDKFKYLPVPENIKPEEAWAALKATRMLANKRHVPLSDTKKNKFSYWIPDMAQEALHFMDKNAAGHILIDEPNIRSEERQRYVIKSIMEEAITSSQLEGAATTRVKAKEMLRTGRKPKDHAERMIYNNYITMTKIKDFIEQPLSPKLLKELHSYISKDTLENPSQEGRFRIEEDGEINVSDAYGQVFHVPPPPSAIEESIKLLCEFANEDNEEKFVHPVIKGILIHFWLAYLHPFVDGNGRTARTLFYWYMLRKGYWLFEFLSISRVIRRASAQYYRAFLYSELDDNDVTYFIMFHLRTIKLAIHELKIYLGRKQRESIRAAQILKKQPYLNHRQKELLANALKNPDKEYTFNTHMRTHAIVYQTARSDLLELTRLGLLEMRKVRRRFCFRPVQYLEDKLGL